MPLSLDYSYLLDGAIGAAGVPQGALTERLPNLDGIRRQLQAEKDAGQLGFAKLPYQDAAVTEITTLADAVRGQCQYLVVIGIGGSDLGTRAVHRALNHQFFNQLDTARRGAPKLFFVGDTTDPVALQEVVDVIDLRETILVMVSKSGNTIEQMSTFLFLRQRLIEVVGEERSRQQIITITDPAGGTLREITDREGYRSLPVPADVGGRFSVLSAVGLFPLAVVGIDVAALLAGAAALDRHDREAPIEKNLPAIYTALLYYCYTEHHIPIRVLMPYIYGLREVGFWYRQLWAESLGKASTVDGQAVEIGPTPIAALGPTDQHSQLQLYLEGPINKVVTFVTVQEPFVQHTKPESLRQMAVPAAYPDLEGVAYLGGHSFHEILVAEQRSTAYALAKAGRPNCTLTLPRLDAHSLGALLYFFEIAVTYAGHFHRINPFDQPAVEVGKRYMYGILGRAEYAQYQVPTAADAAVISG